MSDTMAFGADVSRLLEIVTHALYSNRDVFLRELISNAADACDRLRFDAVTKPDLIKDGGDFHVVIRKDTNARTLTVADNGIGMSKDELIENLGTIAKSGTKALMDKIKADQDAQLSLIGQFGVGFYASFMVAHNTVVVSRKAGTQETHVWESNGKDGFTLREPTLDELKLVPTRGTAVILHLKDDSGDFLIDEKITHVVETYSNHISIPIHLGDISQPQINKASALWMRPKSSVSEEEYKDFYQSISGSMGMDEPLLTSHWKAEGKIEYTGLLFVPSLRPWDLYDPTRRHAVRLYVRRVFIADDCEGLIYPWLRFLRGVVDSEDLPLNISREMLQHNIVVHKIRSGVAKKVLGDLERLSRDDKEAFASVWHQFGAVIKEGLYDAAEHRDDIFKITRFFSSTQGNDLVSLEDYIGRMKPGQDVIYYIAGENADTLRKSPHLEGFAARDIEVLLFKDTIDEFWLQNAADYQGKKFVSITKGSVDLSSFENKDKKSDEKPSKEESQGIESLIAYLQDRLKDSVSAVRVSDRLTDSPVCLVASERDADLHLQRVLKVHQQYTQQHKHVLEINPKHPLIVNMSTLAEHANTSSHLADAADLLLDQARIIQGEPLADPAGFAKRMAAFMQRGLAA